MTTDPNFIRNFSIIAHIDHGKSTLSDRILELTGTVASRDMQEQLLDSMDIERERGITIKSQAVRVDYVADDGQTYQFNLIDTPGHVDFTYEVSRSLAACEGAVLVVDATQGVEAQTVANAMMAMNANLEIIPLINKIDLPAAEPERVREEIEEGLAIPADDAVLASGKTGVGVHDLLEAVVYNIPAPEGDADAPLRALIFDSYFDPYRGVVALVRVVDGSMKKGDKVLMMATGTEVLVEEVGARRPAETPLPTLSVGEVGYLVTGLKDVRQVKVGDTITAVQGRRGEAAAGLPRGQAHGVHGPVPHRRRPVRAAEGGAREAVAQRPGAGLGAREVARARLRLPRGLPRPLAHGGHQRAPRARVRPRPAGHRPSAWSTTCTGRAAR